MFLYLFTTLAMMSVPPELPFERKTIPIPAPDNKPPITQAIKSSEASTKVPGVACGKTAKNMVIIATP